MRPLSLVCVAIATLAVIIHAQPVTYPTTPPAWYTPSLTHGAYKLAYTYTYHTQYGTIEPSAQGAYATFFYNYYAGNAWVNITIYSSGRLKLEIDKIYEQYSTDIKGYKFYVNNTLVYSTTADSISNWETNVTRVTIFSIWTYSAHGAKIYVKIWVPVDSAGVKTLDGTVSGVENDVIIVRAPQGYAFTSTNASAWLDEAYINSSGVYAFSWAPYFEILGVYSEGGDTLVNSTVVVDYGSGVMYVSPPVYVVGNITRIAVNATPRRWVYILPNDEKIALAANPPGVYNVTLSFQDYGEGFKYIEWRDVAGHVVERLPLDANGQAIFHLVLGNSYSVYALRMGEVRGIGTVTLTDLNVQLSLPLDVPPSIVLGSNIRYSRSDTASSTTIAVSSPQPVDVIYEISNDTWSTNITYSDVYNASFSFVHGGGSYTIRVTVLKGGEIVASRVFYVGEVRLADPPWRDALVEMLQYYVPLELQALAPVQLWVAVGLALLVLVTFGVKDALPIGAVGAGIVMLAVQLLLGGVTVPGIALSLLFLIGGGVAFRRAD